MIEERIVYCLRHKPTGYWCTSAKHASFQNSFEEASIFMQEKNITSKLPSFLWGNAQATLYEVLPDGKYHMQRVTLDADMLKNDFEIVPIKMTPA